MMANLDTALKIAVEAHTGQVDKVGQPYILHVLRVMSKVATPEEMMVAVLHDVVEDTDITINNLREFGFSDEVIDAVDVITKRDGDNYDNYLARVSANVIARQVKLADLEDNMDFRRGLEPSDKLYERYEKYDKAWRFLMGLEA